MAKGKCKVVYEFHPYSEHFELLTGDDKAAFVANLAANGLYDDVTIFEDMILDGRNRYLGCEAAGIECRFVEFHGTAEQALALVKSRNIHRRHSTREQRAFAAARLATLSSGQHSCSAKMAEHDHSANPAEAEDDAQPAKTQAEAAEEMAVSVRDLQRAKKIAESCAVGVQEAVKAGEIKLSDAEAIADLSKTDQIVALKAVRAGTAKTLAKAAGVKPGKKRGPRKPKVHRADAPIHIERLADATGADVPDELLPVFEALPRFSELGLALRAVIGKYEALLAEPAGHYLTKADLASLREIVERIGEAWPHSVNPNDKCGFSCVGSHKK